MKRVYNNYFLVGLFTILIGGTSLILLMKMSGKQSDSDTYYSYFTNVTGLGFGNPVYFEGYRVGQVEKITPEYKSDKLFFKTEYTIIKDWKIPIDSITKIQSSGLLSDMSLNINSGLKKQLIPPNHEIPGVLGTDMMEVIAKLAGDFDQLNQEKITPLFDLIYERVDNLTASLDKQIPEVLNSLQVLLNDVNKLVKSADGVLSKENIKSIETILTNVEKLSDDLSATGDWLKSSMDKVNTLIDSGDKLVIDSNDKIASILNVVHQMMTSISSKADIIAEELESASRNVNEAMDEIRKDPSTLIFDKKAKIADEDL
jgi:phospholipid/cholesterol/gamma-HCH transport system substrate-binding protein